MLSIIFHKLYIILSSFKAITIHYWLKASSSWYNSFLFWETLIHIMPSYLRPSLHLFTFSRVPFEHFLQINIPFLYNFQPHVRYHFSIYRQLILLIVFIFVACMLVRPINILDFFCVAILGFSFQCVSSFKVLLVY